MHAPLVMALLASLALSQAQEAYGPEEGFEGDPETPAALAGDVPCEDTVQEDGSIIVCRELEDSDQYLSPIPREVDPKIRILPGFEPPPCENHLLSFCGRFGGGGSRPLMIDLDNIPEAVSPEDRASITRADKEPPPLPGPADPDP